MRVDWNKVKQESDTKNTPSVTSNKVFNYVLDYRYKT